VSWGFSTGARTKGRADTAPWPPDSPFTGFGNCHKPTGGGCHTIGVPVIAEAALCPAPVFGLGAQIFANVNSRMTYGGAMVFLQIGWMP
jgi:hypothetical protein